MEKKRFREALLEKREFIYTLELVPGRGSRGKTQDEILRLAEDVACSRLVHALSVTDNPGGHPALSPDAIGLEISYLGIETFSKKRKILRGGSTLFRWKPERG
jgi:methylenetetrahydrofolate reductase (NADPH)